MHGPPHQEHTNHLSQATSPYLLQHAHNPVDWHEWDEEAFAKAKKEDKPIFLSIGYAACHWCHVMAHESFESQEVAAVLNRGFVAIKVDREERPDIDEIYMSYTQQATGSGGWPMSVWLTPDGVPFLARTYIPKDSFISALEHISKAWKTDRERITSGAASARAFFEAWATGPEPAEGVIPKETIERTAAMLAGYFDSKTGGISGGGTNKFPPSMAMDLMLRVHRHNDNAELLGAVDVTLDHMRRGGIYDHIGGGICRYSTDREWLVPHFEKMLYDQAMVASIYLDGFLVTGNGDYAALAADIFDYVLGDLTSPEGGFYSSRDADSDGLEGAFYIWTVEQIHEALGKEEGELCCAYFDITPKGNWFERMGHAPAGPKNIPRLLKSKEAFAKLHQLDAAKLPNRIAEWRHKLHAVRVKRTHPGLDDKVLTGWNGLMIAALAKGAFVLDEPKYADAATKAADFVLENMRRDDRLLRTSRRGTSRLTAYLSDYAFFIEGLINLYEVTGDAKWLTEAATLTDVTIRHYFDRQRGGFFFTADDGETLIARSKNPNDGAIPAGNSVLAMDLLRLGGFLNRNDYREKAESIFRAFAPRVESNPVAFERLLCAVDFYYDGVKQIAVIGQPESADTKAMLSVIRHRYLPNKIVATAADGSSNGLPLLKGKTRRDGKATAYVCENYVCKRPVTSPADLASQLDAN